MLFILQIELGFERDNESQGQKSSQKQEDLSYRQFESLRIDRTNVGGGARMFGNAGLISLGYRHLSKREFKAQAPCLSSLGPS